MTGTIIILAALSLAGLLLWLAHRLLPPDERPKRRSWKGSGW